MTNNNNDILNRMLNSLICIALDNKRNKLKAIIDAEKNETKKFYYLQTLELIDRMKEERGCEVSK